MNILRTPEALQHTHATHCPGCGHGIINRLYGEVLEEMGLDEDTIVVVDVACGSLTLFCGDNYDFICASHGRPIITAAGTKRVRKNNPVIAYLGDGAAYAIGVAHTLWAAIRNENITAIVCHNGVFGMTGGQMAPTTLHGQKTSSSPMGRDTTINGKPFDVTKMLTGIDMAYLARGSVDSPANVNKTKRYIRKALEKQMNGEGFSLIEVLSPCPTNWGVSPKEAIAWVRERMIPEFPLGEFIERKGGQHA